jgi:iron-sulfur cluster repair protein YtfE (RIC family)
MDALTLLVADHNRVRGLFARFTAADEADDTATMATLMEKIHTELKVHTDIEEVVFYPWARQLSDDIAEVVDEGVQEHHVAKTLLAEIGDLTPGADDWVAKAKVLIENVEHHATEEEDELFPQIRSASDTDALDELAAELEARKADLGAPTLADKADLSNDRLHELATEQEIPGRSSMDHDELAATVSPR